jgi:hypothetical protein
VVRSLIQPAPLMPPNPRMTWYSVLGLTVTVWAINNPHPMHDPSNTGMDNTILFSRTSASDLSTGM